MVARHLNTHHGSTTELLFVKWIAMLYVYVYALTSLKSWGNTVCMWDDVLYLIFRTLVVETVLPSKTWTASLSVTLAENVEWWNPGDIYLAEAPQQHRSVLHHQVSWAFAPSSLIRCSAAYSPLPKVASILVCTETWWSACMISLFANH